VKIEIQKTHIHPLTYSPINTSLKPKAIPAPGIEMQKTHIHKLIDSHTPLFTHYSLIHILTNSPIHLFTIPLPFSLFTFHFSQPTTNNQQPTTDNPQQTTHNRQPTTDNPQQTTHNRQPTTNNRKKKANASIHWPKQNNLTFNFSVFNTL
jgi:hypothetical protein